MPTRHGLRYRALFAFALAATLLPCVVSAPETREARAGKPEKSEPGS